jgi:hypothetical protein
MENSICHRRGPTGGAELADPSAIEMHGACAAFAEVAAFLGPGESTVLAERVKQRYARVDRWRMSPPLTRKLIAIESSNRDASLFTCLSGCRT